MKEEIMEVGVCPRCGAPLARFTYTIEGPLDGSQGKSIVRVHYRSECGVCGFSESRKIAMPLTAAYSLRYMFTSKARIALEKIWLIDRMRSGEAPL